MDKQDKVQNALNLLEEGIASIRSSEEWSSFLKLQSAFHNYSFSNQIMIWHQKPEATRVAGFTTWKQLGRHVKRGEKGIAILAPILIPVEQQEGEKTEDVEKKEKEGKQTKKVGFRVVYVFDVSQTEGQPLAEGIKLRMLKGDCGVYEGLVAACPYPVLELEDCKGAYGYFQYSTSSISILQSMSTMEKSTTLVHEWAHGVLQSDQVTRPVDRGVRELEAESTAYVVCHALGFDNSRFSYGYIATWMARKDAVEVLKGCGVRIQKAAYEILQAIMDHDEAITVMCEIA